MANAKLYTLKEAAVLLATAAARHKRTVSPKRRRQLVEQAAKMRVKRWP
jgi:hypothetical protein